MKTRNCPHCHRPTRSKRSVYVYPWKGLYGVVLRDIEILHCDADGERIICIPHIGKLHELLTDIHKHRGRAYSTQVLHLRYDDEKCEWKVVR